MAKAAKPRKTRVQFSKELAEKICEGLAEGTPWRLLSREAGMPSLAALYQWMDKKPGFAEQVAKAREAGAEACADKALEVAAESTRETVQQDRLHVATLMKRAALIAPRRWGGKAGDKVAPETAAGPPERVEIVFRVRHFERVVGPDGETSVREIKPEGEA